MSAQSFSSLFDEPARWQVFASGQAGGRISAIKTPDGQPGLRLEYDFQEGGGFVAIRCKIDLRLPNAFEIGFRLRGDGPPNHFEFKVAAPGGADVWRFQRKDFALPQEWTDLRFHERELPFAWGPAGGGAPSEIEAIEFVIAAGPGGHGSVEITAPSLEDQSLHAPLGIQASSAQSGHPADAAFDAASPTCWRAEPGDAAPWWSIDFGRSHRFGGLVIVWPEPMPPRRFDVEISSDGARWACLYQAVSARGSQSHIPAPAAETRHLRIVFGNTESAALRSVSLRPDAFSSTPNEFIHSVAADFPRGLFPRYWLREQSYWTTVGSPAGTRRALLNEEGLLEVDEGAFSLEPFILTPAGLVTWADVEITRSLETDGIPLPQITWKSSSLRLDILPWIDNQTLHVTYRLELAQTCPGARLVVAARPFQVTPPWQAFRNLGGRSPIHHISCENDWMRINNWRITTAPAPSLRGGARFEEGGVTADLANGGFPLHQEIEDESGLASAAMAWDFPPGSTTLEVTVSIPLRPETPALVGNRNDTLAHWREILGLLTWQVPDCAKPAIDTFRSAAAHILINRDGPALQPGPRRYMRSWIRDGVIMGAALAKAGLAEPLRDFLTWYAPFQRDDGFIPCVVDRDGVDWLVEHDSHGQFLWGIREVFRSGNDDRFLQEMLPRVKATANFLIALRQQRMDVEFQFGDRSVCFGLLPESASHEGYLAHPVHSYWDDFWAIRGLEAAADLAAAAHLPDDAARWRNQAAEFQHDLLRSIRQVIENKKLAYIPGSVEWADFDPTATSNAIALLDFADALPAEPQCAMFETYLAGFRRKHRGEVPWNNYTAYEIRIIGALVRLGKRDAANELLQFFLADRRPREWNQWPEISWRDPRSPGHLGDLPHTWIAAEYMLALASMIACEREASVSLELAAGLPWSWISEENGFAIESLPTRFGPLDFRIHAVRATAIRLKIGDRLSLPPGGLTVTPPLPPGMEIISTGNHATIADEGKSIAVERLPFAADLLLGDRSATA